MSEHKAKRFDFSVEDELKVCPLCKNPVNIEPCTKDGVKYYEITCSNENHVCGVWHLTRAGVRRRWNEGIARMEEEVIYQEKGI